MTVEVRVMARSTLNRFVENRVERKLQKGVKAHSGCVACRGGKRHLEKLSGAERAIQVSQHRFSRTRGLPYQGKRVQISSGDQLSLSSAAHSMAGHT